MTKREALDEAISEALFSSRFASDPDVRIDGIRKAILAELHEPDDRMTLAGAEEINPYASDSVSYERTCEAVLNSWQAMIDAIE